MRLFFLILCLFHCYYGSAQRFEWVNQIGADPGGNDYVFDMKEDTILNLIYVSGRVKNPSDFNGTSGTFSPQAYGDRDIYIACYDTAGHLLWVNRSGSTGPEYGNKMFVKHGEYVLLSGLIRDGGIINGQNTSDTLSLNTTKAIVIKYSSIGDLIWTRLFMPGITGGEAFSAVEDVNKNLYVTGWFAQDWILGSDTIVNQGGRDMFLIKLDSSGNTVWLRTGGNSNNDIGKDITINDSSLYVVSDFSGDFSFDSTQINTVNNNKDAVLLKLDLLGKLDWHLVYGGLSNDISEEIVFRDDYLYWVGNRSSNGFISKIDTIGTMINDVIIDASTGISECRGVDVFKNNLYLTGKFEGSVLLPGGDSIFTTDKGMYLIHLDTSMSTSEFQKVLTSAELNSITPAGSQVIFEKGKLFWSGNFLSAVSFDSATLNSSGVSSDVYISKLDLPPKWGYFSDYQVYCDNQDICFYFHDSLGNIEHFDVELNNNSYAFYGDTCINGLAMGTYNLKITANTSSHMDSVLVSNYLVVSNQNQPVVDTVYFDFPLLVFEGIYDSLEVFYNDSLIFTGNASDTSAFSPFYGDYYLIAYNSSGCYISSDTIESVNGIDDNNIIDIGIFPNPSKGVFYFVGSNDYEFYDVNVYSIDGKLMHTQSFTGILDLRHLPNGIYLFEAIINGESIIKRIVKFE